MLTYITWKGGAASDYYFWLCDKIGYQDDCEDLLRFLFELEFTWSNRMDENRAVDGLYLRKNFMNEEDVIGDWDDDNPCSILEMLVALAVRVEEEIVGDPDICLFWRMIDHLGLNNDNKYEWSDIVDRWINRKFDRDGTGGIFPVKLDERDQRKQEIWCQCMSWLNENIYNDRWFA